MKNLLLFLLFQFSISTFSLLFGQFKRIEVLTDGLIITKNDTIKCLLTLTENYSGRLKYKIKKEDKKFLKISRSKVEAFKRGSYSFKRIYYNGSSFLSKILIEGRVGLYERHKTGNLNLNTNGTFNPGDDEKIEYYILKDKVVTKLTKRNFRDKLMIILFEENQIAKQVIDLNYDDIQFKLPKIISQYNYKVKN